MTRLVASAITLALAAAAAASCGRTAEQPPTHDTPPASAPSTSVQPGDITFRTVPDPPKAGETAIEVDVKGPNGQPVTDADVSAQFYMAPMPEMKMAEMRNAIALRHESGGRYRGQGSILMAGQWDVTVIVTRGGREIGKRSLTVTAQ